MADYEQARSEYFLAKAELARIDHEIYNMQNAYKQLIGSLPVNGMTEDDLDHRKTDLVYQVSELVEERYHWLDTQAVAYQSMLNE